MGKVNLKIKEVEVMTKKKKRKIRVDNIEFILMCLPAIILVFVFAYLPMGGIILAFKDYRVDKGIIGSRWNGFDNFEFFFKSQDMWRVTRNTVLLNLLFITAGLIAAVTLALILFEIKNKWLIKGYQTMLILPHFLSWVIVAFMVYALLNPTAGIINQVLGMFGKEPIQWYHTPKYWPIIMMFTTIWKGAGMGSVMYFAALMGIDSEYFEAAAIDGATKWQITTKITLPFLVPLMTILTILNIGHIFRADFGMFYQVTRDTGALYPTTDVIDTYVFRALRQMGNVGMSSAVGLYQSVVGFILIITTNAIVKKIEPDNSLF
jgi:putative aldouronate transport system permease protein